MRGVLAGELSLGFRRKLVWSEKTKSCAVAGGKHKKRRDFPHAVFKTLPHCSASKKNIRSCKKSVTFFCYEKQNTGR